MPASLHSPAPAHTSRQQIPVPVPVPSQQVPQASLTPQASKLNSEAKLALQKIGEKGTDLLSFPGLLSSPLPSGLRHKGRCQFVGLPQAIPDLLLLTMKREAGCEKGF